MQLEKLKLNATSTTKQILLLFLILYSLSETALSLCFGSVRDQSRFVAPSKSFAHKQSRPTAFIVTERSSQTRLFSFKSERITSEYRKTEMSSNNSLERKYLEGRNVLLTGASGGLGRSLALKLSMCAVNTIILSARNEELLQEVAEECHGVFRQELEKAGGDKDEKILNIEILTCDLADPNSVQQLAKNALQICPHIDVLINNGGVSSRSRFVDTQLSVDQRLMQINFFAGAALAKAIVPGMVKRKKGCIIWISSVQGLVGIPNRSSYAASKFAVQGYCEALRGELASSGITVHVVSPGYIRTNLSRSAITGDGKRYGKMDETTENGADPDKVAATVLSSVAKGKADFVVAATMSAIAAIWMRLLCPSFLRRLLAKRYEKSLKKTRKTKYSN